MLRDSLIYISLIQYGDELFLDIAHFQSAVLNFRRYIKAEL